MISGEGDRSGGLGGVILSASYIFGVYLEIKQEKQDITHVKIELADFLNELVPTRNEFRRVENLLFCFEVAISRENL